MGFQKMNIHVAAPDDSGDGKLRLVGKVVAPLDADELQFKVFKILQGLELIMTLVQTEKEKSDTAHESEATLDHIEFLASTLADMSCSVLDSFPAEVDGGEPQNEPSVYEARGFLSAGN